jgi:hypothetical protein
MLYRAVLLNPTVLYMYGQALQVLAQHLFHGSDPGHQTEAIERDVHILPSRFKGHSNLQKGPDGR